MVIFTLLLVRLFEEYSSLGEKLVLIGLDLDGWGMVRSFLVILNSSALIE